MKNHPIRLGALLLALLLLSGCASQTPSKPTAQATASAVPKAAASAVPQAANLPEGAQLLAWQGDVAWYLDVTGLYGLINRDGTILAKPAYAMVYPFVNGCAVVSRHTDEYGYLNLKGELVIPMVYWQASPMSPEGVATAEKAVKDGGMFDPNNAIEVVSSGGQVLASFPTNSETLLPFRDGMTVIKGDSYFAVNAQGQVIAENYTFLNPFRGGWASGQPKGSDAMGIVDSAGSFLAVPGVDDIRSHGEGLFAVRAGGLYGYVDTSGKTVIPPQWEDAFPFSDGMAIVKKNGLYGYIDKTGKVVVDINWDYASDFSKGLAVVGNSGSRQHRPYFIIDKSGATVAGPLQFQDCDVMRVSGFLGDHAMVYLVALNTNESFEGSKRYGLIDRSGNLAFPLQKGPAGHYAGEYFIFGNALVNPRGEVVGKGDYHDMKESDFVRTYLRD